MSESRYVLAEKTLGSGKVITRRFTKQTWNAFKPGQIGLDGWKEVVEKQTKPFPEQKMAPKEVVAEKTPEVVVEKTISFPEGPFTQEWLQEQKHQYLIQLANHIAKEKGLDPVKQQKKPLLIETILSL